MLNTRRKPSYNAKRTRDTIEFCLDIPTRSYVLDIGEPNKLSEELAHYCWLRIINTEGDLDYYVMPERKVPGGIKYVTCFEVIEHLMNPRGFFDCLHKITEDDVQVYLSYPSRPKWMWNDEEHFHEYDKLRFNYLLDKTGWKVVKKQPIYVPRFPNGIRPLLRNFIPQTTCYKLVKQEK